MGKRSVCLVINPKDGANVARLTSVLDVFAAAGWQTDIALKEYGGHTMELATRAAKKGYDIVIGYGGDGTLSQVVNGVMSGKPQKDDGRPCPRWHRQRLGERGRFPNRPGESRPHSG